MTRRCGSLTRHARQSRLLLAYLLLVLALRDLSALSVKGNDPVETRRANGNGLPGSASSAQSSVHHRRDDYDDDARRFVTSSAHQHPPKVHAHHQTSRRMLTKKERENQRRLPGDTSFMNLLRKHTERRRNNIKDIDEPAGQRQRESQVLLPFHVEGPSTIMRQSQVGQQRQGTPLRRDRDGQRLGDNDRNEKPARIHLPTSFESLDLSVINASVISAAQATRTDSHTHPDVEHAAGYYGKYQSLVTIGQPQKDKCDAAMESDAAFRSAVKPVVIQVKTSHYFLKGTWNGAFGPCHFNGCPLHCIWTKMDGITDTATGENHRADALWYHIPTWQQAAPDPPVPGQLRVAFSTESQSYYPALHSRHIMDTYEIEMTYRRCSHVPIFNQWQKRTKIQTEALLGVNGPPPPFEARQDAVVYVNSNCGAHSGRDQAVQRLMKLGNVPVHSYGACLRNRDFPSSTVPPNEDAAARKQRMTSEKLQLMKGYKFCIAMENAVEMDWMDEKVWDGLAAGCVPVYLGALNAARDFLPSPDSVVDLGALGSVEALEQELLRLMKDKEVWNKMAFGWRNKPLSDLPAVFLRQVRGRLDEEGTGQCRLCKFVAQQRLISARSSDIKGPFAAASSGRLSRARLRHTHCMRNDTWLAEEREAKGSRRKIPW